MAKKAKTKTKQEAQPSGPPPPPVAATPAPPPIPSPIPSTPAPPPAPSPAPSHSRLGSISPLPPSSPTSPAPIPGGAPLYLSAPELSAKPPSFLATPRIVTIAEEDEEEYDDRYTASHANPDRDDRHPLSSDLLYEPPYQEDWALSSNPQVGYDSPNSYDGHDNADLHWDSPSNMAPPPAPAPPVKQSPSKSIDRFGPTDEVAAAAARLANVPPISASALAGARGHATSTGRTTPAGWGDPANAHRTSIVTQNQGAQGGASDAGANWRPTIGVATWEQTAAKLAQGAKQGQNSGNLGSWAQTAAIGGAQESGRAPVVGWVHGGSAWGQGDGNVPHAPPSMVPHSTGAWRSWGRPQTMASPAPPPPVSSQRDSARTRESAWGQQSHQGNWGQEGDSDEEDSEYDDTGEGWDQYGAHGRDDQGWESQHRRNQSTGWGQGSERAHKVTFADRGPEGTRNVLSPHQRSQILNSLLNQSTQNNYVAQNAAWGHTGHLQAQGQKSHPPKKDEKKRSKRHSHQGGWPEDGGSDWGNARSDVGDAWGGDGGGDGGNPASAWGAPPGDDWGQPALDGWGDGEGSGEGKHRQKGGKSKKPGGHEKQGQGQWGAPADHWGQSTRGGAANGWEQPPGRGGGGARGASGAHTGDTWGNTDGGGGWGNNPDDDDDDEVEGDRRVHFSPPSTSAASWGANQVASGYSMPSKTFMHASNGTATTLTAGPPHNDVFDYPNFAFVDSNGEALASVKDALFGRKRYARDRIHWMFPPDKDQRVVQVLDWIQRMSYNLGEFGLHKFLQSRERGALVTNAAYRAPGKPNEPAFDWLTFDVLQATMDKTIQTSVAFYDPSVQVIVFVFLPSQTGNSLAIWRRKIRVPNNARLSLQPEISMALGGLRKEKDYFVHVDELPAKPKEIKPPEASSSASEKPKKKVRWWNPFEW